MAFTREFTKLRERTKKFYLYRPVPTQFKDEFGKIYNQKDILTLAKKIAKGRGIQINK